MSYVSPRLLHWQVNGTENGGMTGESVQTEKCQITLDLDSLEHRGLSLLEA